MTSISRHRISLPCVPLLALLAATATGQGLSRVAQVRSFDELRGATLANATENLGTVDDLVVDLGERSVTALVVTGNTSSGRRTVEVPYELVTWSETGRNFLVDMPKSELDDMPNFKVEDLELYDRTKKTRGSPFLVATGRLLASELSMVKTRFLGGAEDKLRGVSVELYTGEMAFAMVSSVTGGAGMANLHPLPWNAFCVLGTGAGPGLDPIPEVTLRIDRARLTEAPSLKDGKLDDPAFREKIYLFHHVPAPRFETMQ